MTDISRLPQAERMSIEAECSRLVAGFAFYMDRRRYDDVAGLFTEDCVFERTGAKIKGIDELCMMMANRPAGLVTRHVCAPPFFHRCDAESAQAVTYMMMFRGEGDDAGPVEVPGVAGVAEFHDVFRRTADGWRIAIRISKTAVVVKG